MGIYDKLGRPPKSLLPEPFDEYVPHVTEDDIDKGTIERYFIRQVNHLTGEIKEINEATAQRLRANAMWRIIQVTWRIEGKLDDVMGPQNINSPTRLYTGVITANTIAINEAEKQMPGMKLKLLNPAQYWIGR